MKDTPERDAHFPQWAVRLLPGFQDSVRKLNGIPAGAVSSGLTCIHPDIQGLHALHPNGQGWKTNQGDMGTRGGGGNVRHVGNHTDRQSGVMKRLPSRSLLSDPACPLASPSRSTARYYKTLAAERPDNCCTHLHAPSSFPCSLQAPAACIRSHHLMEN